jgi:trk system potassium uptake protein TrkA
VPQHGLIHLLELKKENLEIVEISIDKKAACAGKTIRQVALPAGSRVISIVRDGKAETPDDAMQLEPGDSVLAILEPGKEEELRRVLARE